MHQESTNLYVYKAMKLDKAHSLTDFMNFKIKINSHIGHMKLKSTSHQS